MPETAPAPILLVTHNETFARLLEKQLRGQGHLVDWARSACEGLIMFRQHPSSIVLVDRRAESLGQLRQAARSDSIPFVGVQAPGESCREEECLEELRLGSDDVICTESYREIAARIRAILRRQHFHTSPMSHYEAGPIRMNLDRHEVSIHGRRVHLTLKEFHILRQFLESPQKVFTRQELLNRVWGEEFALEEHTLDVHIYSLRQKIEVDPAHPVYIVTIRGIGYKLQAG